METKNPPRNVSERVNRSVPPLIFTDDENVPTRGDNRRDNRSSRPRRVAAHTLAPDTRPPAANKLPGVHRPRAPARTPPAEAVDNRCKPAAHCRCRSLRHELADNPAHSRSSLRRRPPSKSSPQLPTPGRPRSRSGDLPRPLPGRLLLVSFFSYLAFRVRKLSVRRDIFRFIQSAVTGMISNVI